MVGIYSHQVYPPIPANVPMQQMGAMQQPMPPPIKPGAVSTHTRGSTRCYICSWSIMQCSDFNCYNNPDICTNNNFSPSLVQQADCPSGCEQFVITDPNGIVQQWRRNCAPGLLI
ncbi:unnamed protein product [Oppiella nova]|uniref:Uncharacterized protein n=1 Tax=Oppiella nova TaxID=334625 RepID=A0A7R9LSS8_9ACAR|nr:unnamed protein product [Oppiella nova]CAG2166588.1 unnamed protein product [Oppiella nova]